METRRVTVRELRGETAALLDRVRDGEAVEVTRRGEVVAVLVPPDADRQAVAALQRQGVLPPDWVERQREARRTGRPPVSYHPPAGAPSAEDAIGAERDEHG